MDFGFDVLLLEIVLQDVRVGGGHPFSVEPLRPVVARIAGHGQRDAAGTEAQRHHHFHLLLPFSHLVETHNAHVGHPHGHGLWNVIVAQIEHFDGEARSAGHQFTFACRHVDAGIFKEFHAVLVEAALGLNGYS